MILFQIYNSKKSHVIKLKEKDAYNVRKML